MTQAQLAKDAGMVDTTISLIERGHANPTWATMRDIAAALDVCVSELARAAEGLDHQACKN